MTVATITGLTIQLDAEHIDENSREFQRAILARALEQINQALQREPLSAQITNIAEAIDNDQFEITSDDEPDEPAEGDLVTYDHRSFFEAGDHSVFEVRLNRNVKVHVGEDEDWKAAVKAYMEREQSWPDVWFVSDHGNVQQLSLDPE